MKTDIEMLAPDIVSARWEAIVEALVAAKIPPDLTTVGALTAGAAAFKVMLGVIRQPTVIGFMPPMLDPTKRRN